MYNNIANKLTTENWNFISFFQTVQIINA